MPEKIVTAYQSVFDQHFDEDTALNKCKSTVSVLENLKKDIDLASTEGKGLSSSLVMDIFC
jgi:regulator of Ty1 transposition protein 103